MKKLVNYEYVDMTPEEIEEHNKLIEEPIVLPPSDKDRLAAIENAIADLAILLSQSLDI